VNNNQSTRHGHAIRRQTIPKVVLPVVLLTLMGLQAGCKAKSAPPPPSVEMAEVAGANAALNKYQKDVACLQPLAEKKAGPQRDLDDAVQSRRLGEDISGLPVTLTWFFGYQGVALSDLITGAAKTWQLGPAVTLPLFTGGRLRAYLALARAQFNEALASYRPTVQHAFAEVSDALIAYQRTREYRIAREKRTQSHRNATDLANIRYDGGVTSYLEVLYNEQESLTAELNLAQARRSELVSAVQLYRALGGGWQVPGEELTKK
jgi:hypothetical protein